MDAAGKDLLSTFKGKPKENERYSNKRHGSDEFEDSDSGSASGSDESTHTTPGGPDDARPMDKEEDVRNKTPPSSPPRPESNNPKNERPMRSSSVRSNDSYHSQNSMNARSVGGGSHKSGRSRQDEEDEKSETLPTHTRDPDSGHSSKGSSLGYVHVGDDARAV